MAEQATESPATHIFITEEQPAGFYMVSPQVPGLAFARPTYVEFMRDYRDALRFAGVTGVVESHHQLRGVAPGGREFAIRWSTTHKSEERRVVADRLWGLVTDPAGADILDDMEVDATGVVTFVCALAEDTLGWFAEQLDERDDVFAITTAVADRMIFSTQFAVGSGLDWPTMADHGWEFSMTVGELMQSMSAGETPERVLIRL